MSQQNNNNNNNGGNNNGNQNRNNGGNQNNSQRQRIEEFVLTDTVIGAEPTLVGFNITGSDIANFIETYLNQMGIRGSIATVQTINTGSVNPKLGIIVSFSKSNREIISNAKTEHDVDILPQFTNNIQTGGLRASDTLSKAIMPLGAEKKTKIYRARTNKKYVYVPICPIKTISAMLKSIPQHSYISVVDVRRVRGEIVITVLKQSKDATLGKNNSNGIYDESMNRHF